MKIDRAKVHQKFGGHCAYCGMIVAIKEMQVDHAIPKYKYSHIHGCFIVDGRKFIDYGLDDFRNLMPSCRVCNNWKRTWTINEFRYEIEMQIERLRKYSAQFRMVERYNLIKESQNSVVFYFEEQKRYEIVNVSD